MSQIIINEAAAQSDIKNLENAKITLQEANEAVKRLMNTAGEMQGQTGTAIQIKANQIAAKLNDLSMNLTSAQAAIRAAVAEKYEQDAQAEQLIRNGGI